MQDGEPNVYAAIVTMRNTYLQMQWQRVQLFVAFDIVAIPLMFALETGDELKRIVSIVGFLIHFALLVASQRAERWIKFYDTKLGTLERFSEVDSKETKLRIQLFTDPEFGEIRSSNLASRRLFTVSGIAILLYWFGALWYYVLVA